MPQRLDGYEYQRKVHVTGGGGPGPKAAESGTLESCLHLSSEISCESPDPTCDTEEHRLRSELISSSVH